MERRLTAILSADVVGYSRLMGEDEVGTLERLKACLETGDFRTDLAGASGDSDGESLDRAPWLLLYAEHIEEERRPTVLGYLVR
ncbi:adenylate class-3/4/guanylyl cyclase [Sinorhizobium meliloti CCNWSX0020]|uniref:Adenylate class-3/4/guanylyl cyclase n=1 Tax=Sinorhizobium meliloti CCNWSX0020 TaxID=1107881 RepID=H0FU75_RHIML|nr:hypothetical protein [Sinorhizobium meliloti]EHK79406.1 adenylate class-3/4/guanylyl cyclase [Sinorhizobium meliloti CCNWSX0020]